MKFAAGIAKMTACTLMLSALFGCGQSAGTAQTEQIVDLGAKTELNVFAAASMTETLNQIAENYKSVEPDVTLTFNFASSGDLLTQIKEGADCDIFISAAPKQTVWTSCWRARASICSKTRSCSRSRTATQRASSRSTSWRSCCARAMCSSRWATAMCRSASTRRRFSRTTALTSRRWRTRAS